MEKTDITDVDKLSISKDKCKSALYNLIHDSDIERYSSLFVEDLRNSRLIQIFSEEDATIYFPINGILSCLQHLGKACRKIEKAFSCLAEINSSLVENKDKIRFIFKHLTDANSVLREQQVTLYFEADNFSLDELINILNALIYSN